MNLGIFVVFCALFPPLFAQNAPLPTDQSVEQRMDSFGLSEQPPYAHRKLKGSYIPSITFALRLGGNALVNDRGGHRDHIFTLGFVTDFRFFRFNPAFGIARLLVESPAGVFAVSTGDVVPQNILSSPSISGGFGGGFTFLDTRLNPEAAGTGHAASLTLLVLAGSYYNIQQDIRGIFTPIFGGLEFGMRYQYYGHRYAAAYIDLSLGVRFGAVISVTYTFSAGVSF